MRVQIGDVIYNSNEVPILLILDDEDKYNLSNMSNEDKLYCSFPEDTDESEILKLIRGVRDERPQIN